MKLPLFAIITAATAILLSSCGTGSSSSGSSSMPGMSAEEHAAMKKN